MINLPPFGMASKAFLMIFAKPRLILPASTWNSGASLVLSIT
jgi:hypothetical protein